MTDLKFYIQKASQKIDLEEKELCEAIDMILENRVSEPQTAALLTALAMKGETDAEITGAAKALRAKALKIKAPENAIDCCGTGGDGAHTLNISTAAALVLAACGVPVAKHGNRAASSKSGTADVLEQLGVPLTVPPERLEKALTETGFAFLMAPAHHQAMRHVAPIRKALGIRTLFNLIGPLANPAGTKIQLLGVFAPDWTEPMARTLKALGSRRAWVVHGMDGLDEITLGAPTKVTELTAQGEIRTFEIGPDDFGLPSHDLAAIRGGAPEENAQALRALLRGENAAYKDVVLANAAAALLIAGKTDSLPGGVALAREALDTGKAAQILERYISLINEEKEA